MTNMLSQKGGRHRKMKYFPVLHPSPILGLERAFLCLLHVTELKQFSSLSRE